MAETNGWTEWSKYVLKELERLNECSRDTKEEVQRLHIAFESFKATMKEKTSSTARLYGALGGAIPAVVTLIILWLTHWLRNR